MEYPFSIMALADSPFRPLVLAGSSMSSKEIMKIMDVYGYILAAAEKSTGDRPIAATINLFTLGWLNGVRGKMAVQAFMQQEPNHEAAAVLRKHDSSFIEACRALIKENKLLLIPMALSQFPLTSYPVKEAAGEDIKRTAKIWQELFDEVPPSIWLPRGAYMPGIDELLYREGCQFVMIHEEAFPAHERDMFHWISPHGLSILPYEYGQMNVDHKLLIPVVMRLGDDNARTFFEEIDSLAVQAPARQFHERIIHIPLVYERMNEGKPLMTTDELNRCEAVFQLKNEWDEKAATQMCEAGGVLDLEWAFCLYACLQNLDAELESAKDSLRYLLDGASKDFPDFDYAHQRMRLHYGVELIPTILSEEMDEMDGAILMLTWEYPPNIIGGMARHVHGLAEALVESGREVIVLTSSYQGSPEYECVNGVHIYRTGPLHEGEPDFMRRVADLNMCLFQKGEALIRDYDISVIHTHDWLTGDAAILLSGNHWLPIVSTIHATEHGRNNGIHNELQSAIALKEKELISISDTVIVCSQPMKEELRVHYEAKRKDIHVIPNGVEFEEKTTVEGRFNQMGPFIFSLGRMVFEKGFQTFFNMDLKSLKKTNIQFIIAGKGPLLEEWRMEARKRGFEGIIHFVGYVSDDERKALFQTCEAAVFPSLYEPFGIVALEAMAFQKPVIASATGGLKSFVLHEQTGLLFEPGNAGDLSEKITTILERPDLAKELGANGHEMAKALYSWKHISEQTEKVYDQTVFIKKMEGVRT
ncbi:glycosyltransferase family 4 protein [Domibacillus mangrovi]|nr:glycosyltransferase family 4 protein [Domibacillus mangrovi]